MNTPNVSANLDVAPQPDAQAKREGFALGLPPRAALLPRSGWIALIAFRSDEYTQRLRESRRRATTRCAGKARRFCIRPAAARRPPSPQRLDCADRVQI